MVLLRMPVHQVSTEWEIHSHAPYQLCGLFVCFSLNVSILPRVMSGVQLAGAFCQATMSARSAPPDG